MLSSMPCSAKGCSGLISQRSSVRPMAIGWARRHNLVGAGENERGVGQCASGFKQIGVLLALTVKSVCGSLAAQSFEGRAAVWITAAISSP